MMDQFVVKYIPGGMSLNHSAWYLCKQHYVSGAECFQQLKFLKRSDYK